MKKNYHISLYLDTRREKKSKRYPVKVRVFCSYPRKQKLYATDLEYTEDEFESIWQTIKPRRKHNEARQELKAIEVRANQIADSLNTFNFEDFERLFIGKTPGEKNINFFYQRAIDEYVRNGQISTASSYDLSLKSLLRFKGKDQISFIEITPRWLNDYENFMINDEGKSQTTVGIYLRPLRAIFNTAIADKTISVDIYPFGKRKYVIPAPKSVKKALTAEQLKKLYLAEPENPDQEKAKAFWFFSYICNGMNIKDILNLQYKNISGDYLSFKRKKTASTKRDQASVTIYLTELAKNVIAQYGNPNQGPETYIFPVITPKGTPEEKHRQILNFIRYINQHFLIFAQKHGINHVSTYYARHTFATNAIRSGFSMEAISEALAHSNLQTTRSYFAGFADETKKALAESLLNF